MSSIEYDFSHVLNSWFCLQSVQEVNIFSFFNWFAKSLLQISGFRILNYTLTKYFNES